MTDVPQLKITTTQRITAIFRDEELQTFLASLVLLSSWDIRYLTTATQRAQHGINWMIEGWGSTGWGPDPFRKTGFEPGPPGL